VKGSEVSDHSRMANGDAVEKRPAATEPTSTGWEITETRAGRGDSQGGGRKESIRGVAKSSERKPKKGDQPTGIKNPGGKRKKE